MHDCLIMGIVNVTPDSFSDGGQFLDPEHAVEHALALLAEGADWLDIGGESTRPGANPVTVDDELARVLPVIREVHRQRPAAVLSIDTSKAEVAAEAIREGASIVNDVTALGDPTMGRLCAKEGVRVILMHMRGTPRTMQLDTHYDEVVEEVADALRRRAEAAIEVGIDAAKIYVDPGIGFGKTPTDSVRLLGALPRLCALGFPVVVGCSRKRFIGELTHEDAPARRAAGSVGAALAAAHLGAAVVRIHDVAATRQALCVYRAILGAAVP